MFIKQNKNKLKQLCVTIWGSGNNKGKPIFKDGKKSKTITVYDAAADELLERIINNINSK